MSLGKNIEKRLKELGLRQSDLVELTGMSKSTINGIIKEKQDPSVGKIKKIAIALHTTTDKLIFDDEDMGTDEEIKRLFIEMKNMNEENKKLAKKMIKALIIQNKSQELKV